MSGVNKAIILGNVGKDPEIKTFQDGGKIATFSVATSEQWTDKKSGEKKEKTEWHSITVHPDGLIEVVKKYVHKGDKIYIEGKIETRKWQDKDGTDRYSTGIIVGAFGGKIELLSGKKDGNDGASSEEKSSTKKREPRQEDPSEDIPF